MVGILIATHGDLAVSLLETAKTIVGAAKQVETISITTDRDVDHIREELAGKIQKLDTGDGVLILTDMFGGTPANISLSFLNEKMVDVITGVNLPMIVKLLTGRDDTDLVTLSKQIEVYGKKNIYLASEMLRSKKTDKRSKKA